MYIFSLLNYVIFFFFISFGLDQNGEDSRESPGGVSSLLGVGSNLFHHIESPTGGTARVCPNTIMGFVLCLSLSFSTSFSFFEKKKKKKKKWCYLRFSIVKGRALFLGGILYGPTWASIWIILGWFPPPFKVALHKPKKQDKKYTKYK